MIIEVKAKLLGSLYIYIFYFENAIFRESSLLINNED